MKVWLDDMREAPEGWEWFKTGLDLGEKIKDRAFWDAITDMSLDHDLGCRDDFWTGYRVACWMESLVLREGYTTHFPVTIHSQNAVGAKRMEVALQQAEFTVVRQPFSGEYTF